MDFWNAVPNNLIVVLNNTVKENGKAGVGGGFLGPTTSPPNLSQHTKTASVLEEQMAEIKWKLQLCVCWDPRVLK